MIKYSLQHVNRFLHHYNNSLTPSIWTFWHKWNYQHTLVKNLLQFSNRVLKEMNRYHVFRWDWIVGVVGMFTGFVVTQLEEVYYQIKIGYKPTTSKLLIQGVLKNQTISKLLSQTLDSNVFRNEDIQFYVHQALINQVITPQKQNIQELISSQIAILNSTQNVQFLSGVLVQNMGVLKQPIKDNALTFLNSETMDGIVAKGLKSILQNLFLKELIADQVNQFIKSYLRDTKNNEVLYQMIRQKVSF